MLTLLGFRAIGWLATILPRRVQYQIAHRVADAHYLLDRKARQNVWANMRIILGPDAPESNVRRESRWVFRSFGMYLCEFFGHRKFGPRYVDEHVSVQGRENLDKALAQGKGAILCSGHYSNWELGATTVAHLGFPITAVVQMHADPAVNAMFVQQRAARGVTVVNNQHGAISALKALRRNRLVAILGDRATGGPIVPVTFFGRRTYLPQGPWRLALSTGAPLIPVFLERRYNYSYRLEIGEPIAVPEQGTREERMSVLAQRFAEALESRVRKDPCQWAVFYRVWDDPGSGQLGINQSLALNNLWTQQETPVKHDSPNTEESAE